MVFDTDLVVPQRNSETNEEVYLSRNSLMTFVTQIYNFHRINLLNLGTDIHDEEAWKYFEKYFFKLVSSSAAD